jgi:non-specific protein-tyrosine kinase
MELELSQYFKGILRWWWLILLCTVIAAAGSYYFSSQQPRIYQTATTLMVGQVLQEENPTGADFQNAQMLAESYAQMAVRQPVLQAAVDSLGLNMGWQQLRGSVVAAPIPNTQLIAISVEDISPERAVAIADQVAYQLVLQSPSSPENQQRQERSGFVLAQLDDLEEKIQTSEVRKAELEAELKTALSARQIQDLQSELSSLERLITGWRTDYLDLLGFLSGSGSPNYLSIIEPAQLPFRPISPNVPMNVALAAVVGFALAVGAALVLEYLDDTIKSTNDLSNVLGLTVLGSVSRVKGEGYADRLITTQGPFSPLSEAYRLVRTNIQYMAVDQPAQTIMITSANPGEGKSLTTANLGVVMAQSNRRTIIVDTDLRQPVMHKIFRLNNMEGVTDLLRSTDLDLNDYLKETGIEDLKIITSGPLPPNSAEMIGSQRMADLVNRLKGMADVILFDSSPVLAVTDASVLSHRVDGVVLVTHAKRTRRDSAKQAIKRLNQVGANLLGAVLNHASSNEASYHHSDYYTKSVDYGVQRERKQRPWWRRLPPFFNMKADRQL